MNTKRILQALFFVVVAAIGAKAQLPTKQVLTLDAAKKIAAASESEARKRGATVVIAVVDDGGYLLVLERLDDTQVASVDVGIAKARTAAIFRRPSKVFEDQVKNGRVSALALPGAVALQGGVPIIIDGKVIGAVGVSGNSPQEDEDIAKVGADFAVEAIKGGNNERAKFNEYVEGRILDRHCGGSVFRSGGKCAECDPAGEDFGRRAGGNSRRDD